MEDALELLNRLRLERKDRDGDHSQIGFQLPVIAERLQMAPTRKRFETHAGHWRLSIPIAHTGRAQWQRMYC